MPTFKITLAYDGTPFVGWQRQASGTSIQGLVEDALRALDDRDVAVTGAGRTDAGVHALGQVASFSLTRTIALDAVVRALNVRLPGEVRVLSAESVPGSFNARFDSRAKTYRYRIWNADVMLPFERLYAWQVAGALDVDAMAASAQLVEGCHDFAAFQAAGSSAQTTEREVFSSKIATTEDTETNGGHGSGNFGTVTSVGMNRLRDLRGVSGSLITYEITGNGFLRHMVRNIVGTLVEVGRGKRAADWVGEVLASRERTQAGPTAPPEGLFLVRVEYGDL